MLESIRYVLDDEGIVNVSFSTFKNMSKSDILQ
jgi:hypothetical protein